MDVRRIFGEEGDTGGWGWVIQRIGRGGEGRGKEGRANERRG